MSHVKAALYDDWALVGSANFDKLVWFFTVFLGRLRDAGVEGHRQASAVFATDRRTENSPTHTASVDEESSGR
jgi:hypothetical protein